MKLSIIIVNYNVKYFLEQCLYSVRKAAQGVAAEILVLDNHSTDGSLHYLKPKFPDTRFLSNQTNAGFARACNRGWQEATGEYILFLNPDTIVPEDCFTTCLEFFTSHPDCGAAGVKMIDGSGRFLRESKRSFPSPFTSLYKLFGLAALFPRSPLFSRYHLGHLDPDENHKVDVLAGAFLMIRSEALAAVGGFDESFFMYGEDIDLSYRIQKAGFSNYYVADTCIIHFKGESTKKQSMAYVRMFYSAMEIFVKKHYAAPKARLFAGILQAGIWLRAGLAVLARFSFLILTAMSLAAAFFLLHSFRLSTVQMCLGLLSVVIAIGAIKWFAGKGGKKKGRYIIVAGGVDEADSVKTIVKTNGEEAMVASTLLWEEGATDAPPAIAAIKGQAVSGNDIIFCAGRLSYKKIIAAITLLPGRHMRFHAAGSGSIVGSDSRISTAKQTEGIPHPRPVPWAEGSDQA